MLDYSNPLSDAPEDALIHRIRRAEEDGTRKAKIGAWDTYLNYFADGQAASSDPEFNLIYVFGSSLIPNLIFQNPYIMAVPQTSEETSIRQSALWEGIDNFLVELMGVRAEIEKACTFAYCTNMGILEIGWDGLNTEPISELEKGTQFPRISKVDNRRRRNFPWVRCLDPREVIFPSGFTDLRHVPWYAKKVCLPKYEVERIPELKGKKIEYNYTDKSDILGGENKEAIDYLKFYILRSVETGKVSWILPDGKVLFEKDDPLQVDGLPLTVFYYNPPLNDIYGSPDVSYIESQYLEGNELRADGRWQRKNATLKLLYDTALASNADVKKFLDGTPLPAIGIDLPPGRNLRDVIYEIQGNVQREYMEYSEFLIKDTEMLLGFGPNQMGTISRGRRTATEIMEVAQNNLLRISKRRDSVANALSDLFAKINLLVEKNWKEKQTIPILGADMAIYYASFTSGDLKGLSRIKTKVSADSLAPSSVEKRREDMIQVMGILGQFSPDSAQMLQPLIQKFISLFDWGEVKGVLPNKGMTELNNVPVAGENPMQNLSNLTMLTGGKSNGQKPPAEVQS